MAEQNPNVDGLDEAASQYDFLRSGTPNIQMPTFDKQYLPQAPESYLKSNYPSLKSIDNPAYPMRDQGTGVTPLGFDGLPKDNTANMDFTDALHSKIRRNSFNNEDKNVYAKTYSYDASPQGAHMARYKAYGQETFDKIGFNPELNNEAIFNEQTTMVDDFARMFTHSAWPMLKLGFMAPMKSYYQLFSGDNSNDIIESEKYQELNAIGYSTKGGLGGFTNNLLLSASYSAGIIGEAIAEGMVMGAVEGSIVGPEGTIAGGAIGGALGAAKGIFSLPKSLWQMGKYGSQMLMNLKNAQKYNVAKQMFKAASTTVGDFINPISNTRDAFANNVFGNSDNLSRMARAARTFGGFYNDVKNINAALSEGALEAGFVENDMYKNMYDKYYSENGIAPSSEEQRQMRVQAQLASAHAKMYNTSLIFYTNKITFPAIFKGGIFKSAQQTITRNNLWKVIFDPKKDLYETVKVNWKNALKGLVRPANYGKVSLAYFKTNVAEGIQENLQDVIADSTEKYFTDAYKNEQKRTTDYAMSALYMGLNKQLSEQGFETFMSGFAMGAVLRPMNNLPNWLTIGYNKYFKSKEEWTKYQDEKKATAQDLADAMNLMHAKENGADFLNMRTFNLGAMGSIAKVTDDPQLSTKDDKDKKHAALTTALITVTQSGLLDTFMNNFKGYSEMTAKELEEAWNLEAGEGEKALTKISEVTKTAKSISSRYEYAMKNLKPKVNLADYKKGTPEYDKALVMTRAHQIAVRNLIFLQESFDKNLERINSINNEFATIPGLKDVPSTYVQALLDPERLSAEMRMLETEVEIGGEGVEKKKALLDAFEEFQSSKEFFTLEFLAKLKEKFNSADMTQEEQDVLNELEQFGARFREMGINPEEDYKAAFAKLLKAIVGQNQNFDQFLNSPEAGGSLDNLFQSLLDFTQLKTENTNLTRYISLLLDEDGFAEHVDRNFEWMSKMYNNRKDYYKEVVSEQIKNVEFNSLLADLADEGIYVDLDEFAEFVKTGLMPTYFIDSINERIITQDSVLWEDYIKKFEDALESASENAAGDPSDLEEQLAERIRERNEQRANELDDARKIYLKELKIETGKTEEELLKLQNLADDKSEENKKRLEARIEELKALRDRLANATIPEIEEMVSTPGLVEFFDLDTNAQTTAVQELVANDIKSIQNGVQALAKLHQKQNLPIPVDPQGNVDPSVLVAASQQIMGLREIDDKIQKAEKEVTAIKPADKKTTKLEETKAYKAYQKAVSEINDKYDKLIDEIKAEFAKKATGTSRVEPTIDTPWEELPVALRDKLTPLFEEFKTKNNITPEEEVTARQNWLKTQSAVIAQYNKDVAEGMVDTSVPKLLFFDNEFEVEVGGPKVTLDKLKLYEIKALRNTAQKYLDTNKKPDPTDPNKKKTLPLTQEDKNNLENDLRALNEFINAVRSSFRADARFEAKLNLFKERILDRQGELEEELDENGNVVARYLDGKIAQRVTKHAEMIQSKITGNAPFIFGIVREEVGKDGEIKTPATLKFFRSLLDNDTLSPEQKVAEFIGEFRRKYQNKVGNQFNDKAKIDDLEKALKKDFSEANLVRTINNLAFRESTIAGNTVDVLIRDFLTLDAETGFKKITRPSNMTQEAFDALFGPNGIITEFRDGMIDNKFFILSNNLNVFDSSLLETGLAGAMDIVAIDENGDFFIVDIKTSTAKNWDKFDTEYLYKIRKGETIEDVAKKYNTTVERLKEINADTQTFEEGNTIFVNTDANTKKLYFRLQQSIYRNLFYNMTGEMPKRLGLLPIELTYDLTGFITSAKRASIVPQGMSTVDLEYASEVEDYGVTLIKPEFEEPTAPGTATPPPPAAPEAPATKYVEEQPEDTSLGANIGKTVLYRGRVGKLVLNDDGTFGVEFPNNEIADLYANQRFTADGTTVLDVTAELVPVKDKAILAAAVGVSFMSIIEEPLQSQVVDEVVYTIESINKKGTAAVINGVEYTIIRNNTGTVTSLRYNANAAKIKNVDARTQELTIELNKAIKDQKKARENGELEYANKLLDKIRKIRTKIQALNIQRKELIATDKQRFLRGGNMEPIILALNSTPKEFNKDAEGKTGVDEVREEKKMISLATNAQAAQRCKEIVGAAWPSKLDDLLTKGISSVTGKDVRDIVQWLEKTIVELEDYGFALLSKDSITTDVENWILELNDLLNDLKKINIKKNGEISKQNKAARDIFKPEEEVPSGSNVPAVQKSTTTQPERVPGVEGGTTTEETELEAKKADIERRRQEEIDYRYDPVLFPEPAILDEINAKYDKELARELYKEMKAGKMVTEMTPAEQEVADKYITPELRASVDAELAASEPPTNDEEKKKNQQNVKNAINQFNNSLDEENLAASLLGQKPKDPTSNLARTYEFIEKIASAGSKEALKLIYADAHAQHVQDPTSIDIEEFDKQYSDYFDIFDELPQSKNLNKGDMISLFMDDTVYVVQESNPEEGTVTVKELGTTDEIILDDKTLVTQYFKRVSMDNEPEKQETVKEVDQETKESAAGLQDSLEEVKKDPNAFDNVKKEAETADPKTLMNKLKKNSKEC